MKKLISNREILFFIFMLFIITALKSSNLTYGNFLESFKNVLFFYNEKTLLINTVSLLQYFILILIVVKRACYRLTHFISRYRNRRRYLFKVITDTFLTNIILTVIMIFLQGFLFLYIKGVSFNFDFSLIQISVKLIFELFISELILIILILITKQLTYSYLIYFIFTNICLHYAREKYIPLISVYLDAKFNIYLFGLMFILIGILYFLYQNLDIGGELDEVESN